MEESNAMDWTPSEIVSHMVSSILSGQQEMDTMNCKITKELVGCIKSTLWMPDSDPEGMLCSKLEKSTRQSLADGVKKLIKQEMLEMPEDQEILQAFSHGAMDVMSKQFTLWSLPFDQGTIEDMINDMLDVVDGVLEDVEEGSEDDKFYNLLKTYLSRISDETKENLAKVVARVQGKSVD